MKKAQKKKQEQVPSAIRFWTIVTGFAAFFTLLFIINGVGDLTRGMKFDLFMIIPVILHLISLITFIGLMCRRFRLFIVISNVIIAALLLGFQIFGFFGIVLCNQQCVAGGGLDGLIILMALLLPTIFFTAFSIYLIRSEEAKTFFIQ